MIFLFRLLVEDLVNDFVLYTSSRNIGVSNCHAPLSNRGRKINSKKYLVSEIEYFENYHTGSDIFKFEETNRL